MKLKALSKYDGDSDTRFGDCILLYSDTALIVFDCGHERHAEYVRSFLQTNTSIVSIAIVVSHNDCDHTNGVCNLLSWLATKTKYTVKVYTHQYLKYVDLILDKIDDGRRNRESLKNSLLAEFDNIRDIIEAAQEYGFDTVEALAGVSVGECTIVGPTVDEFTDVAAKAVDSRESNMIGTGHAEETVMNAASLQLKCRLDNNDLVLLCGDASPDYLKNLSIYNVIQLPHHGQETDALAIFDKLDDAYLMRYIISDNTGSSATSGGSDKITKHMKAERYTPAYNTRDGVVDLPNNVSSPRSDSNERRFLGDLDRV